MLYIVLFYHDDGEREVLPLLDFPVLKVMDTWPRVGEQIEDTEGNDRRILDVSHTYYGGHAVRLTVSD